MACIILHYVNLTIFIKRLPGAIAYFYQNYLAPTKIYCYF